VTISRRTSAAGRRRGRLYAGTSGWTYDWEGFYPDDLPNGRRLDFYSQRFSTVEVNYSFYHLPRETTYEKWAEHTPKAFVFALKLSRYITHIKRLEGARDALREFTGRAARLGAKLGPLLVQLPPSFRFDAGRLERFLEEAREVGKEHGLYPLRLAFEFRHPTWFENDARTALESLKQHGAAFVCGHSSRYPYPFEEPLTADFMYLRFHGPDKMFASAYGERGLERWVPHIRRWLDDGIDVFAYFNNDFGGHAVRDARALVALMVG
jgi:uncharacterized protein YecE (DUF72 family)